MNKEELKKAILQAQQDGDIAKLYTLEQTAYDTLDEEALHGYYANILDFALERLTDTLEAHRVMDMNEVQDFATLRALYEYAIEHYSANDLSSASALFEVLSGLSNDEKFSKALKLHQKAADTKMTLVTFLENVADIDATQTMGTFYISEFSNKAQELLDVSQSEGK